MGILIKGGAHLETLGRLRVVAFDKTGTLTLGQPRVVGVHPLHGVDEAALLHAAASVEVGSAHPLAQAIVDAATERGWGGGAASNVEQVVGKGLRGVLDGDVIEIGSLRMIEDDPDAVRAVRDTIEREQRGGATAVVVRRAGAPLGVIALADTMRTDAPNAIAALRRNGVERIVMLTGDNEGAARAIAQQAGVDEHHAALLPEDKMREVARLRDAYGRIAMVGDGVNDAPALAAASVGVAMGAAGSDVALETADVALMHDDLAKFPETVRLAKFARRIIAQNLVIALGVIALLAPLAITGVASIGWAVVFHEGSTIVVVLNALRLLRFKPEAPTTTTN